MSKTPSYGSRWSVYSEMWDAMERTRLTETRKAATRLFDHKSRYIRVEEKTKVPWYMIACIHYRESDANFNTQLAQGDPLGQVSTHVPKGQGPYFGADAWERAALIALEDVGLTKVIDWRLEKIIYYWEKYNGWGYFNHGVPSAYVWAASNQYTSGKYIADGVWSPSAVDQQLGCAAILKTLMELDNTIQPIRETKEDVPIEPIIPLVPPTISIVISPPGSVRVIVTGSAE